MTEPHDPSRREFLRLAGLAAAGTVLTGCPLRQKSHTADLAPTGKPVTMAAAEAAAQAFADAGAGVLTTVPATGAWHVFASFNRLTDRPQAHSFNEETAYTIAHGAALSGTRSAVVLKSHGLAKAANSVMDSLSAGTTAGCVALVTHDPLGTHSDNIFDLTPLLKGMGIPYKSPQLSDLYEEVLDGFLWSERLGVPVAVFVNADDLSVPVTVRPTALPPTPAAYERDPYRHILCPPLAPFQRRVLETKLSGGDWRALSPPALRVAPEKMPPKWQPTIHDYAPFFDVFRHVRRREDMVTGDTGVSTLFAFPPYDAIDACTYYGGSLPLAIGALAAGRKRAWAVTGDYAFVAAGHMGLPEAVSRRLPLKVVVLSNGRAATTGGQPIPAGVLSSMLGGYARHVRIIENALDRSATDTVLRAAAETDRLEVVVAEYPKG